MYSQLREWHQKHGSRLSILLYPSDEFGEQELPAEQIPAFVSQYLPLEADSVHLMAKVAINGDGADPVWRWLTGSSSPFPGAVEWNFDALFLLDKAGVPAGRYSAMELDRASGDVDFLAAQS